MISPPYSPQLVSRFSIAAENLMLRVGLRHKLLLEIIVVLLLALAVLVWVNWRDDVLRQEFVLEEAVSVAQVDAANIDSAVDDAINVGWALAEDANVRSLDPL